MRRAHHLSSAVAAVVLLISLSAPWFRFELPSGVSFPLTGLEASTLGSTLLAVAFAAYGASLLTRGLGRRLLGGLQALVGGGVLASWSELVNNPAPAAQATITQLTGLSGANALETVSVTGPGGFFVLGVLGALSIVLSGVLGVFASDAPARSSRYERSHTGGEAGDPVATWDDLSEGHDPTKR